MSHAWLLQRLQFLPIPQFCSARLRSMEVIPGPRAVPILGNYMDLMPQDDVPQITQLENLADTYGPIYQFTIRGKRTIVCSSAEFLQEIVDEKRFLKVPPPAVQNQKPAGLFAAESSDPDWGQAHRILNPSFGPIPIESMFEGMCSRVPSNRCLLGS